MTEPRQPKWEPKGKPWLVGLVGYMGQPMPYEEYDPDFMPPEVEAEMDRENKMWIRLGEKRKRRLQLEAEKAEAEKKQSSGNKTD